LVGFTDSDWAGDNDDQKSTSGYVFHFSTGPLVWSCKKQKVVSLSTTKAEYHGTIHAGTKAVWIHQLLGELGFPVQTSTTIYCDNQSAIQVVDNPVSHSKMKHVELHAHYLRQLVHENIVSLVYCRTDDQVVDIFTKPLSEARFIKLHTMLGLQEAAIMGGCPTDIISPPESPESCVDGGVLEHQVLMVHHTSPGISRSGGRPTSGNSRSGDRPDIYISQVE
jgi:hypothetical protein